MNINRKKRSIEKLKNREYRDSFVSSSVDVGVAFQIRVLRKQRKYTQKKMAKMLSTQQERISFLENPSNSPSLSTLKRIANAFDVGLIVRFVPMGELLEWQLNLSSNSLDVTSFEEDPYFQTEEEGMGALAVDERFRITSAQESSKVLSMESFMVAKKAASSSCLTTPAAGASRKNFAMAN